MRSFLLSTMMMAASALPLHAATASSPAPACAAIAAPPPELAGWTHPSPLNAGTTADSAPALTSGAAARVALAQADGVHFLLPVGRAAAPADKGGLLTFVAPAAATYRVALGAGGWIDMVRGTASIPSSAHTHGPDRTGIRKMVDFPLAAGAYTIQLSGAAMDAVTVLIVRLP